LLIQLVKLLWMHKAIKSKLVVCEPFCCSGTLIFSLRQYLWLFHLQERWSTVPALLWMCTSPYIHIFLDVVKLCYIDQIVWRANLRNLNLSILAQQVAAALRNSLTRTCKDELQMITQNSVQSWNYVKTMLLTVIYCCFQPWSCWSHEPW
jgi:hypothetical protein